MTDQVLVIGARFVVFFDFGDDAQEVFADLTLNIFGCADGCIHVLDQHAAAARHDRTCAGKTRNAPSIDSLRRT